MSDLPPKIGTEMGPERKRSFLDSKDNGVLSMGAEDRGYGLPVSYSYDEDNDRLIVRFVSTSESKKEAFAAASSEVTLTVYSYEDVDSWQSVIVTGTIHAVSEGDFSDRFAPLFFRREDDSTDAVQIVDSDEFESTWYELRIDDLSGRHSN
ncbi:pyridoxamine 5'-phosphate oxidase family protein [Natronobacterium gregoryi]|uniref:Flavin-nucleotide-binding protein n=2 Tax=Natronobacterium gregoryi TaxID=44930 RepID=L0AKW7_NATGS|nr:pyridoxamine 5'-phosphate oxidase family protein [Natronobacterium gregoryi]AFZ74451.1 putative flavin-nucleotide-binding protein [Natronobacterium gregoryi SP2]ELY72252.1 pyridoxamine 5'-phosphate oxidase-like FMN-binding protein [Natronobacterium gregoryi SP2]PLK21801.1 pyridoxamine 5'-phosphate oxidase family protein [Natronobacterium gregoryi SP2]SFJ46377.1 Pyridoxamine 5'-phosphate oxidase [Natronobacterium gregoryi]